jgi:hypothetical protein
MKKLHYSQLTIGQIYYLDESFDNIGLLLELNPRDIIFKSIKNRRFSETENGNIEFFVNENMYFYEKENQ